VVNTLRGDDGSAIAAAVTFDVNYRFPGAATFTGLHIHDGAAGVAGMIHVPTDLSATNGVVSATGFGNISRLALVSDTAGLATVNSMLSTPQNQYVNLHTTVNPGGAVRAQIAPTAAGPPKIDVNGVISAVNDKALTTAAPGDLITIYGTNLASNSSGLGAFQGQNVPTVFNGVQVTIGGKPAPLIYVSPRQINAQVPFETPAGAQPLIVTADGTAGAAYTLMVAATAPGIFMDAASGFGILVKQDFSLLTADNRAHANDIVIIYATGLGQTTPPSTTGQLVQFPPEADTQAVTITINGQAVDPANVIYSIVAPNFIGLYQVAFRVPTTVPGGNQRLQISVNGVNSNTVIAPFISVDR
ncbi:MAG: IPT/TIG domain-containing protein, partial [Acidobacteriota bacterium]|nr:IPT/TIG domain-containing protein [Acidobacteriota bacterium]